MIFRIGRALNILVVKPSGNWMKSIVTVACEMNLMKNGIRPRRTWFLALTVLFTCVCGDALPQATSGRRSVSFDLVACSHDGGVVTVNLVGDQMEEWTLRSYGAVRVTDIQVSRLSASHLNVKVSQRYQDRSIMGYEFSASIDDQGRFRSQSMLSIDYSADIRSSLRTVEFLYERTRAALRSGSRQISCERRSG